MSTADCSVHPQCMKEEEKTSFVVAQSIASERSAERLQILPSISMISMPGLLCHSFPLHVVSSCLRVKGLGAAVVSRERQSNTVSTGKLLARYVPLSPPTGVEFAALGHVMYASP